jgi:hypothetical protein
MLSIGTICWHDLFLIHSNVANEDTSDRRGHLLLLLQTDALQGSESVPSQSVSHGPGHHQPEANTLTLLEMAQDNLQLGI